MPLPSTTSVSPEFRSLSESLLSLMPCPAALVADGDRVVAVNAVWKELIACGPTSSGLMALSDYLPGFSGIEALVSPLRSRSTSSGAVALLGPESSVSPEGASRPDFAARWTRVEAPVGGTYAVVVLEALGGVEHLESVINSQRISIKDLLIRQTLIEERERRRLGRALHDGIAQELARLRVEIANPKRQEDSRTQLVGALDTLIESVRELAFELSPPILEDLGIRPALHWLADHLSQRYGAHIEVADDVREPRISPSTRTIVFRAVRELAINAAKHAKDAEIILSCATGERTARFGVHDTGPGFDSTAAHQPMDGPLRFGLLSVKEQIEGIGGSFEIVSSVGEGASASITVPLECGEDARHA